ncbi:tyrosine-type recombinase/integrase [Microvirga massiliensis]|uniref:tyrosine-type recombinase/integrase n=1 Tax=Microvirga massiliensis TaxID=1033741 RepID=UPI000660F7BE|nr:tyrosine-type recombinase/integrase [Microvirga massiliensis]
MSADIDIYAALPTGLTPRGLTLAAAAAYLGLTTAELDAAIQDGKISPPTLPFARFDRPALDADLDQLSGIREKTAVALVGGTNSQTSASSGPQSAASLAYEAWKPLAAQQIEYLRAYVDHQTAVAQSKAELKSSPDKKAPELIEPHKPDLASLGSLGPNLRFLCQLWQTSGSFKKERAASTQAEYRRMLNRISEQIGDVPLEALNDPRSFDEISNWHELIGELSGPREADNRMSVLSALLSWASGNSEIPTVRVNQIIGFERLYVGDRSGKIFSDEQIEVLLAATDPMIGTGVEIASETALRISDVLRLPWSAYDGEILRTTIGKRRKGQAPRGVAIPCTERLKRRLDGMERVGVTILTTPTGYPWERHNFSRRFRAAVSACGIEDRHFHDLRGTAITRFARLNFSAEMISSITGHSVKTVTSIIEKYLKRDELMARSVIAGVDASRKAG